MKFSFFLLLITLFLIRPNSSSSSTSTPDERICPFESLFQFGDSISDVGNLIREGPAGARSYAARFPYGETFFRRATGRCSNGLLMVDYFALALHLPFVNPYLGGPYMDFNHGVNFAVAGSTALPPSFFQERNIHVPSTDNHLKVQLNWFHSHLNSTCQTSAECRKRLQRALVLMGEIGGNDYNYAFFQGKPMGEIRSYVPHVVRAITDGVREVIQAGAVRIIVPGNFPVGCIPIYLTSFPSRDPRSYDNMHCLKDLNEFARFHNDYLQQELEQLRQEHPQVVILYADYYSAFQSVLRRAPSLGFERGSLMRSCCGIGGAYNYDGSRMCGSPGVPVCANPNQHIHWDGVHLTEGAYMHMAEWLLNDLLPRKVQCVW